MELRADNSQPAMTWQWFKDEFLLTDETQYNYEATTSGIFHAVIRNATGCETVTDPDTVIVQASPVVDLNDETLRTGICQGNELRLVTQQVIGQTYQWLKDGVVIPGETTNHLDIGSSGIYAVRVNNALCEKLSDPFNLLVHPLPVATITNPVSASVCEGEGYALSAEEAANYTYQWLANNQLIPGETQPLMPVTKTGNYAVRMANEFNCQHTSPVTSITVNLKPPAGITPLGPTIFCEDGAVELLANAGTLLTYQWIKDGIALTGSNQQPLSVTEGGSYEVGVTNRNQCTRTSDPIQVQVVNYPVATIGSATGLNSICQRDSLQLIAGSNPSYDFAWFRNDQQIEETNASFHYAKISGDYKVIASVGSCRDTSSVLGLQVRPNPLPLITRNGVFLSIAQFGDIQWYLNAAPIPGATLQSIRTLTDRDYQVNVVNGEGCSAWSGEVPVCLPVPEVQKQNDVLTVSVPAAEYVWEFEEIPINGDSQRQLTAQQSGRYSVVVTNEDGCTMETNPVIVCIPYPYVTLDDITGVLYANPNPASAYQWYFEGLPISNGNTQVHIPDHPGMYTVVIEDLEGCVTSSESFVIAPVTGSEKVLMQMVKLYPNPATDHLTIEVPGAGKKIQMVMMDPVGREIHNSTLLPWQRIDLTTLSPGMYTIIVRKENKTASWQLVKE